MLDNKIHPTRLGFDFDGVVADTAEAFIRLCCEDYGYCSFRIEDITDFEVERCLDVELEIVEEVFTRILLNSVEVGLKPMPGAVKVLNELTDMGMVTLVTARSDPDPVRDWLFSVMPTKVSKNIKIVAMGAHDDKPRYVREHGLECFIDDRAETCHQLNEAGIQPIVFAQPWNHGRHSFNTVSCWEEIKELCL